MKMNNGFLAKLDNFCQRNKILRKDDKVIVGISGGADSTALLIALWKLRHYYRFSFLAAHVNYNLRKGDSKKDEEFVKNICFERNIPLVIKNVTITSESDLENQARNIRFEFFSQLKKNYKMKKILLGHNRKDQAETFLFRLFRGAGYTGISGIQPNAGDIAHPLLPFSRKEIETFLRNENIQWRDDLSNQNNKYSRNILRNELLPWLQDNVNNDVINKIYQTSQIFLQTDRILHNLAKRRLHKAKSHIEEGMICLDLKYILKLPEVLRFYLYREIYGDLKGDFKDFYHANFEAIESLLKKNGTIKIDLPHKIKVFKEYESLIFADHELKVNIDLNHQKKIRHIRNRLTFEDYRLIMKKMKKIPSRRKLTDDDNVAYIDLDKTAFPIYIRHRQPGDKFCPLGMKHSKKLKDFFIDEKIPKFERDSILILWDEEKIIWVAGHRIDDRVATSSETKNILMLKIEKKSKKKMRAAERYIKE